MFLLGVGLWILGIIGCYAFLRRRYNSLASQLSDDLRERAEQFWQWVGKQRWRLGMVVALIFAFSVVGAIIILLSPDTIWSRRLGISVFVLTILGLIFANYLAYFNFDRRFRGSNWSIGTYLRWWVMWNCWTNWMLISWLIALEVLRQFAISFPTAKPQPHWTVVVLTFGFGLSYILLTKFAPKLLRWEKVQDEALLSALDEMTGKANLKPMELWQLNIPGGLIPLGLATPKAIAISDFMREQLTLDEMKAVFAHELAHLKLKHLWKRHFILLGFLALETVILALLPLEMLANERILVFAWLIFWLFARLMLPIWQRHELQADKWSAELVGDRELVARTLEKIHTLAFLPAAFPKGIKFTHPSLMQRLELLRQQHG